MSRLHHVASVLNELAAGMGLAGIVLDESDRATLAFGDTAVTFVFTAEPLELLWLYAELGDLVEGDEEAHAFLLRAGLASWATGRMTIGLDSEARRALAYTALAVAQLDHPTLLGSLTAMLQMAMPIRARVKSRDYRLDLSENSPVADMSASTPGVVRE